MCVCVIVIVIVIDRSILIAPPLFFFLQKLDFGGDPVWMVHIHAVSKYHA